MGFPDKLKYLRDRNGITQQDLANILNKTRSAVAGYESEGKEPDFEALKKLSAYFNVSIDYLLESTFNDVIKNIPVLGTIRAGVPLLAQENWEHTIEIPKDLNADFALRVTGDSMSWVGIYDGDLAILRQSSTASHGTIVAAGVQETDWCATLKFYIEENGTKVLRAANPNYKDMRITEKHRIIGQLVSIQKTPPALHTYKDFLTTKELSDKGWSIAIEKAVQYGLNSDQISQMIELFSHMVKQIG